MSRKLLALIATLALACSSLEPTILGTCGNGVTEPGEDCDPLPDHAREVRCGRPGDGPRACKLVCAIGDGSCPAGSACGPGGTCQTMMVCGNGIEEPGEDCDSPDPSCGGPIDTARACRFVCGPGACQAGYSCVTGICVFPASFDPAITVPMRGIDLRKGDFDGDGHPDLAKLDGSSLVVRFGRPDGSFSAPLIQAIDAPTGALEVGDINGDAYDDLVLPGAQGLTFLEGESGETFGLLTPAVVDFPPTAQAIQIVPLLTSSTALQHELMVVEASDGEVVLGMLGSSGALGATIAFPVRTASIQIADTPVVANLDVDPARAEEELIIALAGTNEVRVFSPRAAGSAYEVEARAVVTTRAAIADRRLVLADLDPRDGILDLIVPVEGGVEVAFGDGAGGFRDINASYPLIDEVLAHPDCEGCSILAVDDLDGDQQLDFITSAFILVSGRVAAAATQGQWEEVVGGDFNRDGRRDFALNTKVFGVDLLLGTAVPGVYNPATVGSRRLIEEIHAGDFNGDQATDLALVERDLVTRQTAVSVMFGNDQDPPSPPVEVARTPRIISIRPLHRPRSGELPADRLADLVVVSEVDDFFSMSLLTGTTDRRMSSTFVLDRSDASPEIDVPRTVAIADLTGDGLDDLIIRAASPVVYLLAGQEGHRLSESSLSDVGLELLTASCGLDLSADAAPVTVTGDTDRDGQSEVTFVTEAALCTLRAPPMSTAAPELTCACVPLADDLRMPTAGSLRDVDGDGHDDLLVTFVGNEAASLVRRIEEEDERPDLSTTTSSAGTMIVWGSSRGLDGTASIIRSTTWGDVVFGATAINADGDARLELALVTPRGIRLADVGESRAITVREGYIAEYQPRLSYVSVQAADVSGDGLEDLVVDELLGFRVLVARPSGPKGGER